MAKSLNKNRMLGSKVAIALTIGTVFLSRQYWPEETPYHEIFELTGTVLVALCAIGRIYATAFLGGFKNEMLVTHGIYSIMRNPLYFFTLLGVTGVALMSNHLSVIIGLPLFFVILYSGLIQREQAFLQEKFGDEFLAYKKKTRALIPNFSHYTAPQVIEINPRYIGKAFMDAIWWLMALPLIEFSEYLQEHHILPTFFIG